MRIPCKVLLALGVAALLAVPALADAVPKDKAEVPQRLPFGGFGFGGPGLLLNKSVQEELKITDEQRGKLKTIAEDVRAKHKQDFDKLHDLKGTERFEKVRELVKAVSAETKKATADVLNEQQSKRLRQIALQQRGLLAIHDSEVSKALKLTNEEEAKLKEIGAESFKKTREIFGGAKGDRAEAMKRLAALRHESMEKATAVLSPEQQKAWRELTGTPFEVRYERRPDIEKSKEKS
jgi:Spy/CpxP family protein refolding chaperone